MGEQPIVWAVNYPLCSSDWDPDRFNSLCHSVPQRKHLGVDSLHAEICRVQKCGDVSDLMTPS